MSALTLMGLPLPVIGLTVTPERLGGSRQRSINGRLSTTFYRSRDFIQADLGTQSLATCQGIETLLDATGDDTWDFFATEVSAKGVAPSGSDWSISPIGLTVNSGWVHWSNSLMPVGETPYTAIIERNGQRTVKTRRPGVGGTATYTAGTESALETLAWFMGWDGDGSSYVRLGPGHYTSMMILPHSIDHAFARWLSRFHGGLRFGLLSPVESAALGSFRAHVEMGSISVTGSTELYGDMSLSAVKEAE